MHITMFKSEIESVSALHIERLAHRWRPLRGTVGAVIREALVRTGPDNNLPANVMATVFSTRQC